MFAFIVLNSLHPNIFNFINNTYYNFYHILILVSNNTSNRRITLLLDLRKSNNEVRKENQNYQKINFRKFCFKC